MSHDGRDAFYVGYQKSAPVGLHGFLRRTSVGVVLLAVVIAGALLLAQKQFSDGVFEFGVERTFEGIVVETPYPVLWVDDGPSGAVTPFLTSAFGKHGAGEILAGFDGRRVRLQGTAAYRDDQFMIEVVEGTVEALADSPVSETNGSPAASESLAGQARPASGQDLGEVTVKGEIVDSKCFLGVMKPGRAKPHKACAIRCISGGVPPILVVESLEGERAYLLLVDREGAAVGARLLDFVAEPIAVTGQLSRVGDRFVLAIDPSDVRILE